MGERLYKTKPEVENYEQKIRVFLRYKKEVFLPYKKEFSAVIKKSLWTL